MTTQIKKCKRCGNEKPLDQFSKYRYDYTSVCQECVNAKRRETLSQHLKEARNLKLADFSPRELMLELKRRGYEGKLTFVETHFIDLKYVD